MKITHYLSYEQTVTGVGLWLVRPVGNGEIEVVTDEATGADRHVFIDEHGRKKDMQPSELFGDFNSAAKEAAVRNEILIQMRNGL